MKVANSPRFGQAGFFVALTAAVSAACSGSYTGADDARPVRPSRSTDNVGGSSAGNGGTDADGGAGGGPSGGTAGAPISSTRSPFTCSQNREKFGGARIWRLTRNQFNNAVASLLGDARAPGQGEFFKGAGVNGYLNGATGLGLRDDEVRSVRLLAKDIAKRAASDEGVVAQLFEAEGCASEDLGDEACARNFISRFGARAFRRPLTSAEEDAYFAVYGQADAELPESAIQLVLEAMLQSPKFLFRSELGGSDGQLSSYEMASALSFTIWDDMPDAELFEAAAENRLGTATEIEAQIGRMLTDNRAQSALGEFYRQWLEYENLLTTDKSADLFPEFSSLRGPMGQELTRFMEGLLSQDDTEASFEDLFLASSSYVNGALAEVYDVDVEGDAWRKVDLNPELRSGVLTMPGFLAHLSALDRTSPVKRGEVIQKRFFCTHIDDPDGDIDLSLPDLEPGMTRREQLEAKTNEEGCQDCHRLMNGIGFGLENYDAIGRFRTEEENGETLDTRGSVAGTEDADGAFQGGVNLQKSSFPVNRPDGVLPSRCSDTPWGALRPEGMDAR